MTGPFPRRRTVGEKKQARNARMTRNAAFQIGSVLAIILPIVTCVSYGLINYGDAGSWFAAFRRLNNFADDNHSEIFKPKLQFEMFHRLFLYRHVVMFSSHLNSSDREGILALLRNEYKDMMVPVGHSATQTIGGQTALYHMKLSDYLDRHNFTIERPHYIFDSQLLERLPLIADIADQPPELPDRFGNLRQILADFDSPAILAIGKNNSGLAFHQHRHSWNDLLCGEKQWFIYPPEKVPSLGFDPWQPQLKWLETVFPHLLPEEKPIMFVQKAGQIVYVPEGWYHATRSVGLTVSVTKQPVLPKEGTPYYYMVQGEKELTSKRFDNALMQFRVGLNLSHDRDFNLMRKIGEASEKIGDKESARLYYEKAIQLNRLHPASYVELIGLLIESGQNSTAENYLHIAAERGVVHAALSHYNATLLLSNAKQ